MTQKMCGPLIGKKPIFCPVQRVLIALDFLTIRFLDNMNSPLPPKKIGIWTTHVLACFVRGKNVFSDGSVSIQTFLCVFAK